MGRLLEVRYVLIALAAGFAIGIAALIGLQINRARQETLDQGFRDARNLASTLAQHTHQSFLSVDLVLQGLTAPELAPIILNPRTKIQAYQLLRNRARVLQGVLELVAIGADGHVLADSNEVDAVARDLSAQPQFEALRQGGQLALSPPVTGDYGPSKGNQVIKLSRRMEAPDGRFLGIVEASIAIDYFLEFYTHLDIGNQGVISVIRRDGVGVIRYPFEGRLIGPLRGRTPIYDAYRRSAGQGELFATYVSDKVTRLTAFRDVPDLQVFVSVGLSVDDMLAGWRRSAMTESAAGATLVVLLALLAFLADRFVAARETARQDVTARLNRLAASSADIAAIHTSSALVAGMRRVVQELVPGGMAEVKFAPAGGDASMKASIEPRMISLPLQAKNGKVLGALQVSREDGPPLSPQDAAVLAQLATISSVALENVDLLAESHQLTRQAERARAEEAEARRRIEDVFATMSEGVYTLDHAGRFTFLNDNAVTLLRRTREQLEGHVWWQIFPKANVAQVQATFEHVAATQTPAEFEHEYEVGEGTRWMDIRAFPTHEGMTVYIRDISQRVETEGKLRQAQKMEAIGQLTGGIAHDFNNLLTVIIGNIDTLVDQLTDRPNLRRVAESAHDAALRGATLIARLLAFARRQALAPRSVDINALTRNVEDLLRRTIGDRFEIRFERAAELWRANIDQTQMENALLNLALNARDAMPGGGTLTIVTANARLAAEDDASDAAVVPGEYVMVSVRDTGTGMTADVRSRAFDPFFTTKPVGQGSGLGLSMVYGFVRQSGGRVRIDSEVGHGSTISMYLPRADAAETVEVATPQASPPPAGHETILLVEDDELVREHLSEMLRGLGYAIIPCATGREAIDMIGGGARPDVLLTDVILAGEMNGHGVAQRIKQLRPELPVLYMSGYTEDAISQDGRLDPGIHFISKPFRRHEIARKLRDVLAAYH